MGRGSNRFSTQLKKGTVGQAPWIFRMLDSKIASLVVGGHHVQFLSQMSGTLFKFDAQQKFVRLGFDAVGYHAPAFLKRTARKPEMNFKFRSPVQRLFEVIFINGQSHSSRA